MWSPCLHTWWTSTSSQLEAALPSFWKPLQQVSPLTNPYLWLLNTQIELFAQVACHRFVIASILLMLSRQPGSHGTFSTYLSLSIQPDYTSHVALKSSA